jgi:hypothetical protein
MDIIKSWLIFIIFKFSKSHFEVIFNGRMDSSIHNMRASSERRVWNNHFFFCLQSLHSRFLGQDAVNFVSYCVSKLSQNYDVWDQKRF